MSTNHSFNNIMKLLCFILAAAMLFSLAACTSGDPENTAADSTAPADTTEAEKTFDLSKDYVIVRPDTTDDNEVAALQLVGRCLRSYFGSSLSATTDFVKSGQEVTPAKYEILIGATNRNESQEALSTLEGSQGVYKVISENVIVICGGTPAATLEAAIAFCSELFGYTEDLDSKEHTVLTAGELKPLTIGKSGSVEITLPIITLNGTDLREYKIVTELSDKAVTTFVDTLLATVGGKFEVITPAEYTGGAAFLLGYAPGEASGHISETFDAYSFYAVVSGDVIAVDWSKPATSTNVLKSFVKEIIPAELSTRNKVTLKDGVNRMYTVSDEYNMLVKDSETTSTLATGITYSKILYKDRDGANVRVYAVTVAKGSGRLYAGLPDDAPTEVSGKTATTMNAITSAAKNGVNVIAGFNSGFFDLGGTGLSRGLVVKEGVVAASNTERPFIAQLKDGTVKILTSDQYASYKDQINTAVAGNIILLSNGRISSIAQGTAMAYTRHPRTAAGYNAETGEIVVIEVDGRQPTISNGASYLDLITIFRDLGCTDVINLDGGGSSTCIIKDASGNYVLQNSPSDGSMRKLQDSLLIVAN